MSTSAELAGVSPFFSPVSRLLNEDPKLLRYLVKGRYSEHPQDGSRERVFQKIIQPFHEIRIGSFQAELRGLG